MWNVESRTKSTLIVPGEVAMKRGRAASCSILQRPSARTWTYPHAQPGVGRQGAMMNNNASSGFWASLGSCLVTALGSGQAVVIGCYWQWGCQYDPLQGHGPICLHRLIRSLQVPSPVLHFPRLRTASRKKAASKTSCGASHIRTNDIKWLNLNPGWAEFTMVGLAWRTTPLLQWHVMTMMQIDANWCNGNDYPMALPKLHPFCPFLSSVGSAHFRMLRSSCHWLGCSLAVFSGETVSGKRQNRTALSQSCWGSVKLS